MMRSGRLAPRHMPLLASVAVLLLAFGFGALRYEHFASVSVVRNLLVDNAFLGIAAVAATFVILLGGIDLSVGSVMALTGIVVATLVEDGGWHPAGAFALGLAIGAGFGAGQGLCIQAFRIPAFLVTLAGMFLARGLAFAVHEQNRAVRHPFVSEFLGETCSLRLPLGGSGVDIPVAVVLMLLVFAAAWVVLRHTRFGRAIHATGDEEHAALLMGLPVGRTRVLVYTLSGFLSALAGIAFVLYQQSGDPASCRTLELDAIAAVVIGGTLLRGGVGSVLGTAAGVATLGLIQTIIAFEGDLDSWWARIIVGALVLAFVALQGWVSRVGSPGRGVA